MEPQQTGDVSKQVISSSGVSHFKVPPTNDTSATNESVDSGYRSKHIKKHQAMYYVDDLRHWHSSLNASLQAAGRSLLFYDANVVAVLSRTKSKLVVMSDQAVCTLVNHIVLAQTAQGILPALDSSNTCGDAISMLFEWLSDAREVAHGLRAAYIDILEDVRYMIQCVEVDIDDSYADDGQERPLDSAVGNNYSSLTGCSELSDSVLLALKHLHQAQDILEACSDAWLSIHNLENILKKMIKDVKKITTTCSGVGSVNMRTLTLRRAVESVSRLYCVPHSTSRRGKDAQRIAAWTS